MIGMIQILIYLLAVYLIFKAFEILQIAIMSSRADRRAGLLIGFFAVVIGIGAAGFFVDMADKQAESVSGSVAK